MAVDCEDYFELDAVVLTPTDELLTADVVHELHAWIDDNSTHNVIINFRAARCFVSGSLSPHAEPLTPLLKLNQQLREEARRLVLCNFSLEVAKVFQITRLDQMFEVQRDLDAALAASVRKQ